MAFKRVNINKDDNTMADNEALGTLTLVVCDEDAKVNITGYLHLGEACYPVALWINDDEDSKSVAGGCVYDKAGKDNTKIKYISLYRPDEEKKYAYSVTLNPVDKESDEPRLVAFLYRDYNCESLFHGNVLPKRQSGEQAPAATTSKAKKKPAF